MLCFVLIELKGIKSMHLFLSKKTTPHHFSFQKLTILVFAVIFLLLGPIGCLNTRGIIYVKKDKVGTFLAKADGTSSEKEGGKSKEPTSQPAEASGEEPPFVLNTINRASLQELPDGRKIMGGYCNEGEVKAEIQRIQEMQKVCGSRVNEFRNSANLFGGLYWGFLGATFATGAGMVASGLLIEDKNTAATLAVVFGSISLVSALTSGFGSFGARQELYKKDATKLDNYMWTVRARLLNEVCNAPSQKVAQMKAKKIGHKLKQYCTANVHDDGVYRP